MKRAGLLLGALALVVAVPAGASESLEIVEVDVSAHPQVSLTVVVPGSLAGVDLPADAFTLVEEGYPVDAGVWTSEQEPLRVVLVLDTSGSMQGGAIDDARAAAVGFIGRLPSVAEVAVVSSGGAAEIRHPLDADHAAAAGAVEGLEAAGETALYDASIAAASLLPDDGTRSVLVVLSDGGDTVSEATLGDAVNGLQVSGAEVYVIGLQTDETDAAALSAMAAVGGGPMIAIEEAGLLEEAFGGIADDLAGRYRLVYLTRRSGPVDLVVGVAYEGVTAVAGVEAALPGAVPAPAATTTTEPAVSEGAAPASGPAVAAPPPTLLAEPWTLPAGVAGAVIGAAALLALVVTGGGRRPAPVTAAAGKRKWRGLVTGITRRAEGVTDRVLQVRRPGRLERDLDRAGLALRPSEFVLLSVSFGVAAVAASMLIVSPPAALLVAVIAFMAPRLVLKTLTARRRAAFADQFDGTLQMLSGSLRAGYGLMQSVGTIAEEASNPTANEFARVAVENRLGRSVEESLGAMADRMDNEDLRWVVEAIDIQYEVGGDLAEVLDTVAGTIRDRDQIRRQVKALSAEGRISAVVLVAMPFAIALLISMVSPDYLAELTGTTLGRFMIAAALLMIGAGAAWISRIVKVVF